MFQQKSLFEASEKKLEIIFSPQAKPLRSYGFDFWQKLCKTANTRIIQSGLSNSFCDSYILSESSLFVWDYRLLILTCGHASLIYALLNLLKKIRLEDLQMLFYQRKNELSPRSQKTSFRDDLQKITKKIAGQAFCFGCPDDHHFYLFHSSMPYQPKGQDQTVEILMYDLEDNIKEVFFNSSSVKDIRQNLAMHQIFKNTQTNDYLFKPHGYSLNGIQGKTGYYTIHVTPQEPGFYVSFETNITEQPLEKIIHQVVSLFKPSSVDVVVFSPNQLEKYCAPDLFIRSSFFGRRLGCGYYVQFSNFFKPYRHPRPPFNMLKNLQYLR